MLNNVILIGFMGCGKTSVGRELSKLCRNILIDTDDIIATNYNMTISNFFARFGESEFRQVEISLCNWMKENLRNATIAVGGGLPVIYDLRDIGSVIYLESPFEELYQRILGHKSNKRPLFDDLTLAKELYDKRIPIYEEMADYTVSALGTTTQVAEKIYNYIKGY